MIVGLFVATWALALAVWKLGRIEERWSASLLEEGLAKTRLGRRRTLLAR